MSRVTRNHTLRLTYGRRIECETVTDRDAGTVQVNAHLFDGCDPVGEHVATASTSSFATVGELISWRNRWLAQFGARA